MASKSLSKELKDMEKKFEKINQSLLEWTVTIDANLSQARWHLVKDKNIEAAIDCLKNVVAASTVALSKIESDTE